MIILIFFNLALNATGGYETPIVGFREINYGANVGIALETKALFFNIAPGFGIDFYQGDNQRYSIMNYKFIAALYETDWIVSPYIGLGVSYLKRSLVDNAEIGYAFIYQGGGQLKISIAPVSVFLRLLYNGLTDSDRHGGYIGYQIGFSYKLKGHEKYEY